MKLVKKVREYAGLNPWQMHKLMKKSMQSYMNLERKTQKISIPDLMILERIYTDAGGSSSGFYELLRVEGKVK